MSLSLYYVDKKYVDYLQNIERVARGYTHVPNMEYDNREQKFICGVVLELRGFQYYVPVTSYSKKQPDNILIEVLSDKIKPVKGSLRFNYMFPAPKECVRELIIANEPDSKRKNLLNKELNFILANETRILNKARQTYSKVINKVNYYILKNSCDFKLLEGACNNYIVHKNL